MKLSIVTIGHGLRRTESAWLETYQKRLSAMIDFEHVQVKDKYDLYQDRNHPKYTAWLKQLMPPKSLVYWLDEHGQSVTTMALAKKLSKGFEAYDHLVFVVGGAYGLPHELLQNKKQTLRLSDLTLPHKMAALLLHEQLYRCFCIQKNLPYHHT